MAITKKVKLYLVAISEDGNKYMVILEQAATDGHETKYDYKTMMVGEQELVAYLTKHPIGVNVEVKFNHLKGTTGDLSRYKMSAGGTRIILGELRDLDTYDLLGYRIASSDGKVTRQMLKVVLKYCANCTAAGKVPIANAQYVGPKDGKVAYLRSYVSSGFPVENIKIKKENPHAKPAEINKKENEKSIKKLTDMFTEEQIKELKDAKAAGVDIRIIGNNKLSAKQMNIIWTCEAAGLPGRKFADPSYSVENMEFMQTELETGGKIDFMLNPAYSAGQLFELSLGAEQGVDIALIANPKMKVTDMAKKREDLANKRWKSYKVIEGSLKA